MGKALSAASLFLRRPQRRAARAVASPCARGVKELPDPLNADAMQRAPARGALLGDQPPRQRIDGAANPCAGGVASAWAQMGAFAVAKAPARAALRIKADALMGGRGPPARAPILGAFSPGQRPSARRARPRASRGCPAFSQRPPLRGGRARAALAKRPVILIRPPLRGGRVCHPQYEADQAGIRPPTRGGRAPKPRGFARMRGARGAMAEMRISKTLLSAPHLVYCRGREGSACRT